MLGNAKEEISLVLTGWKGKTDKADKLGIPRMNEVEFLKLIKEEG